MLLLSAPMMPALFPCFSATAPGQGEAFGNQGFTDILVISTNPGEGAPVTVLSLSIDLHPLPPEELSKPFLRLEACHQLGITPRAEALRSVQVQEPDPLGAYGDCISTMTARRPSKDSAMLGRFTKVNRPRATHSVRRRRRAARMSMRIM